MNVLAGLVTRSSKLSIERRSYHATFKTYSVCNADSDPRRDVRSRRPKIRGQQVEGPVPSDHMQLGKEDIASKRGLLQHA